MTIELIDFLELDDEYFRSKFAKLVDSLGITPKQKEQIIDDLMLCLEEEMK